MIGVLGAGHVSCWDVLEFCEGESAQNMSAEVSSVQAELDERFLHPYGPNGMFGSRNVSLERVALMADVLMRDLKLVVPPRLHVSFGMAALSLDVCGGEVLLSPDACSYVHMVEFGISHSQETEQAWPVKTNQSSLYIFATDEVPLISDTTRAIPEVLFNRSRPYYI